MPKASKKKQRKAEDFKKVKLKVGKKKAPPSNSTDTSFTSKSIVLTGQSITADKSNELTNSRNLTLKNVLTQLRHYNATTRKEAIAGLADFLSLHPEVLGTELGSIIDGTVKLIVDNEPVVRKALLRLYTNILPGIPRRDLAPFVPLVVIFTCSAMTHILDDIRSDAVKYLNLLIEIAPSELSQYSAKILPNFFSLLETNTQGTDDKKSSLNSRTTLLTQGNRLDIMRSCYSYLAVYTQPLIGTSDPLWFMSDASSMVSFSSTGSGLHVRNFCDSALYLPYDTPAPFARLNLFSESMGIRSTAAATATDEGDAIRELASSAAFDSKAAIRIQSKDAFSRLFQFLQATWMESSTMFGTNQIAADHSLELCVFVMQILQTLWQASYSGSIPATDTKLVGFLRQCMVHFPFGGSFVGPSHVEESLLSLNIMVCELTALLKLGTGQKTTAPDDKAAAEATKWSKRAVRFVLQTLGCRPGKPPAQAQQQAVVNPSFKHSHFAQLLPVIWRLMHSTSEKDTDRLLVAVIHYASACQLSSASKTLCIQFLSRVVEMQWQSGSSRSAVVASTQKQMSSLLAEWALGLPKVLWQLRDKNMEASKAAIQTLRLIAQRTRLLDSRATETLQSSLITLFCVDVPGKGTVFGPFKQYPEHLQASVLEIVHYIPNRSDKLMQAIQECLADKAHSSQAKARFNEIARKWRAFEQQKTSSC
ncbi:rRNA processing protein [Dipsacomyces acuminosporus]|nr:rRNA processing protein [Dipsacomyces acuminosporus]